ncbi:MAG: response regulator [Verrucomicrobiota bacterium]|nr:response regulator [Verrucomicrobiota bacterium]
MRESLSIVLVDNEAAILDVMSAMLTSLGHKVVAQGKNGHEAVSLYKKHLPDILITDFDMPVMKGLDAAQIIKNQYPDAIIVICSGSMDEDALDSEGMKIVRVLPKPVSKERLRIFLEARIEDKKRQHSMSSQH